MCFTRLICSGCNTGNESFACCQEAAIAHLENLAASGDDYNGILKCAVGTKSITILTNYMKTFVENKRHALGKGAVLSEAVELLTILQDMNKEWTHELTMHLRRALSASLDLVKEAKVGASCLGQAHVLFTTVASCMERLGEQCFNDAVALVSECANQGTEADPAPGQHTLQDLHVRVSAPSLHILMTPANLKTCAEKGVDVSQAVSTMSRIALSNKSLVAFTETALHLRSTYINPSIDLAAILDAYEKAEKQMEPFIADLACKDLASAFASFKRRYSVVDKATPLYKEALSAYQAGVQHACCMQCPSCHTVLLSQKLHCKLA